MENNVIKGTRTEGERVWFSPNSIINREQMATLLYRLAEHDGLETDNYSTVLLNTYADGWSSSKWAQDAMAWCVMNRLMAGTGNNKLSPKMTLSYGQLAKFMKNYGDLKESQAATQPTETPDPTPVPTVTPDVTPKPTTKSGNYNSQTAYPEDAKTSQWLINAKTYNITDLSGPWDNAKPVTSVPNGGYIKNGHRYNKYGVCIDSVNGLPTDEEKKAIILINQHRVNNGLKPLIWDQSAQVIAETRALESCTGKADGHVRPDGEGCNTIVTEWNTLGVMKNTTCSAFSENIHYTSAEPFENESGYHEGDARDAVKGWINSTGHNAALLNTDTAYGAVAFGKSTTKTEYHWFFNSINVQ